jgi:hypothetical protein
MTIQIELDTETETRLIAEAGAKGLPLEKLAEQLLKTALAERSVPRGRMSVKELHRAFGITEGSERLPNLPRESFMRESFDEGRSLFGRWRP